MDIHEGDQVLVNLAPFIGSPRHCKEAIPCKLAAIDGRHVEISTHFPYRELSLRVERTWIDAVLAKELSSAFLD